MISKTEIFCKFWDSHQVRKAHEKAGIIWVAPTRVIEKFP